MASALARHPAVMALDRQPVRSAVRGGAARSAAAAQHRAERRDRRRRAAAGLPSTAERALGGGACRTSQRSSETGKPQVSELMTGRMSGKPTVVLAYPVARRAGRAGRRAGSRPQPDALQTLFSDIPLPDGSVVTLTDAESRVLARSRDAELYIGKPQPLRIRRRRATCRARRCATGLDGVERSYGNAVIDRGPWLLSVGIPTSVATARSRRCTGATSSSSAVGDRRRPAAVARAVDVDRAAA